MLVSVALGIFIACIIYVVVWSVKNDAAKSIENQDGFIRMRVPRRPRALVARRDSRAGSLHNRPERR